MSWLGAEKANESSLGCIPNVASGTNNTAHKAIPTIIPLINPSFELKGAILDQKSETCPNMLAAAVPVNTCNMKPMYCANAGSLNPNDIPMTAKNVPAGVPEITSTITRRPEVAHALIKPAREQYNISCL